MVIRKKSNLTTDLTISKCPISYFFNREETLIQRKRRQDFKIKTSKLFINTVNSLLTDTSVRQTPGGPGAAVNCNAFIT